MQYRNTEIKIDQFVAYCNESKINLSPAFQRGHVWNPTTRSNLLRNILQKKPIPAVFLYKEASGSKYSYNILDGKQRLESIILFVSNKRADFAIKRWTSYFESPHDRGHANFAVNLPERNNVTIDTLTLEEIRDFREYSIPTIEITLDDETNLDEVISLFVDINQHGVKVSRFQVVRAMAQKAPLLQTALNLIALKKKKRNDIQYKLLDTDVTRVLRNLKDTRGLANPSLRVDRIWEKLVDLVLFYRSGRHRKSSDALQLFMRKADEVQTPILARDKETIRAAFSHARRIIALSEVARVPLQSYTHLYTLLTVILRDLGEQDRRVPFDIRRYVRALETLHGKAANASTRAVQKLYKGASLRQTNDPQNKEARERAFRQVM